MNSFRCGNWNGHILECLIDVQTRKIIDSDTFIIIKACCKKYYLVFKYNSIRLRLQVYMRLWTIEAS